MDEGKPSRHHRSAQRRAEDPMHRWRRRSASTARQSSSGKRQPRKASKMAKQCSIVLTVERAMSAVAGERRYIVQSVANSTEYISGELFTLEEVNDLVKSE